MQVKRPVQYYNEMNSFFHSKLTKWSILILEKEPNAKQVFKKSNIGNQSRARSGPCATYWFTSALRSM